MARILIVDDDEMDRVLLAEVLHQAGHESIFSPNGATALRVLEKKPVDVVVTDIVMPELDGIALIEKIREEDPWARVIAISGASDVNLEMAGNSGAMAVLKKPVDPEELVQAIDKALEDHDTWKDSVLL